MRAETTFVKGLRSSIERANFGFRTDVDVSRLDAYSEEIHRAAGLVESKKPVGFDCGLEHVARDPDTEKLRFGPQTRPH